MSSSLLHLLLAAALVRIVERAALVEVVARVGPGGVYAYTHICHICTRADIYRAWTWRAHGGGVGSTTVELGAPLLSTPISTPPIAAPGEGRTRGRLDGRRPVWPYMDMDMDMDHTITGPLLQDDRTITVMLQ